MGTLPDRLAGLTRGDLGTATMGTRHDVYAWPLAVALLLLLLESVLPDTRSAAPGPAPASPHAADAPAPRHARWWRRGTRTASLRSS